MIRNILTAALHNARSPRELRERHETFLRKRRSRAGIDIVPHVVADQVLAVINHGRWIFRCTCHSGVLAHPAWPEARCFGCGAVYTAVQFPADRTAIEALLVERSELQTRNWIGEPVDRLTAENIAHGVPVPVPVEEESR